VTIVPRWEWRTFGPGLEPAGARFRELDLEREDESDETYLLSTASDASVKIRGGQMDVKTLQDVNDDGLEQWLPVLKASFPIAAEDVAMVFDALDASVPTGGRDAYTLEELLRELVEPSPDVGAVDVHKHRAHYTFDGCMAELSEVRTDAGERATLAVESPDAEAVIAAVRDLGLDSRENTSLPRGLKQLEAPG
jgi:exopolyphosphatase/guanosine-5'-triphosphate,3'-diphosphate pyrophosphatase